jgi:hypothetical protein
MWEPQPLATLRASAACIRIALPYLLCRHMGELIRSPLMLVLPAIGNLIEMVALVFKIGVFLGSNLPRRQVMTEEFVIFVCSCRYIPVSKGKVVPVLN